MAVTVNPRVIKLGGAWEERYAYAFATDGHAFAAGDLIRISTTGTVELADTTAVGSVHGIALETVATDGVVVPVLMFADDTIIKIQCAGAVAPEDLSKGSAYTLDVSTGAQGITSTATGVAIVVDYAATGQPWTDAYSAFDEDVTVDGNSVLARFSAATLAAHIAAT